MEGEGGAMRTVGPRQSVRLKAVRGLGGFGSRCEKTGGSGLQRKFEESQEGRNWCKVAGATWESLQLEVYQILLPPGLSGHELSELRPMREAFTIG